MTGGGVWQALPARHPRVLGDSAPAHGREGGGCVWRLCAQYRAQSSDIRCQAPAVFLKMSHSTEFSGNALSPAHSSCDCNALPPSCPISVRALMTEGDTWAQQPNRRETTAPSRSTFETKPPTSTC